MIKQELECGCEMLVYQDGSAAPEVAFCQLHRGAQAMRDALLEIREGVEARAREHACRGYHCSTCAPALVSSIAYKALETAGVKS